jgi:cytochrome c oxidase cbb3-type subunit 3
MNHASRLPRALPLLALAAALALGACDRAGHSAPLRTAGSVPQAPTGPVPGPGAEPAEGDGPYTGNPVATREGRQLFVHYNCSGCHGGRAGGGMGPSLRDEDWIYGGSGADIFDSITQGRAHGMPAWGTRIPQDQAWKLVAYVKSLRTPGEPDAPAQ